MRILVTNDDGINAHGLKISGTGKLSGRAKEFMTRYDEKDEWWIFGDFRPRMFMLVGCKDLEVRDITFAEAPEWGLHMLGCEHVLVDKVKIRNLLDVPNCDGIGPDHCRDVEIKNCDIVCGDDGIVLKSTRQTTDYGPCSHIRVKDCVIANQDSGLKIGVPEVPEEKGEYVGPVRDLLGDGIGDTVARVVIHTEEDGVGSTIGGLQARGHLGALPGIDSGIVGACSD